MLSPYVSALLLMHLNGNAYAAPVKATTASGKLALKSNPNQNRIFDHRVPGHHHSGTEITHRSSLASSSTSRRIKLPKKFTAPQAMAHPPVTTVVSPEKSDDAYERHIREAQGLERAFPAELSPIERQITKAQALAYGVSFFSIAYLWCLGIETAERLKLIHERQREGATAHFVGVLADKLLRVFPFIDIEVSGAETITRDKEPTIWVSNHVSELDLLVFLILEGRYNIGRERPIKFLYWDKLRDYPVLSRFLRVSGMIPVAMEDTGFEVDNQYKLQSLKDMYRKMDDAVADGFDIAILPEGRRNKDAPTLAKAFPGAFKLAKKHGADIGFIGTHGVEQVWNVENGFHAKSKKISVKFWENMDIESKAEFMEKFYQLLG